MFVLSLHASKWVSGAVLTCYDYGGVRCCFLHTVLSQTHNTYINVDGGVDWSLALLLYESTCTMKCNDKSTDKL